MHGPMRMRWSKGQSAAGHPPTGAEAPGARAVPRLSERTWGRSNRFRISLASHLPLACMS
jgi:hypothetical protein